MMTLEEVINKILKQLCKKQKEGKIKNCTESFAYHELNDAESVQGKEIREEYRKAHDYNKLVKSWVDFYCAYYFQQLLKEDTE